MEQIDANIPLAVKPPQLDSPTKTLGEVMQMRHTGALVQSEQLDNQKKVRDAADDAAIRAALSTSGSDPDAAIKALQDGGHGPAAVKLEGSLLKQRGDRAAQTKLDLENHDAALRVQAQMLTGVTDEASFQATKSIAAKMSPEAAAKMGDHYDPDTIDGLIRQGTRLADQIRLKHDAVTEAQEATRLALEGTRDQATRDRNAPRVRDLWTNSAARTLANASNDQEWQQAIQGLRAYGAPADVLNQFGSVFSPAAVKKAKDMQLTEEQRQSLGMQNKRLDYDWATLNYRRSQTPPDRSDPTFTRDMERYKLERDDFNETQPTRQSLEMQNAGDPDVASGKKQPFARKTFMSFDEWRQKNGTKSAEKPAAAPAAGSPAAAAPAPAGGRMFKVMRGSKQQSVSQLAKDDVVTLKNGSQARITAVHPDGTFDADPMEKLSTRAGSTRPTPTAPDDTDDDNTDDDDDSLFPTR